MTDKQHKQTEDEAQEDVWKRAFDLFDKNKDGSISLDELGKVMRSLNMNPTEKDVKEAAKVLDRDGNGRCDFQDFKAFMKEQKNSNSQEEFEAVMLEAFKIFDHDGNNYIDEKELRMILTKLGEPVANSEVDIMMKYADLNGDGKIEYLEFVKLCMKPCL